MITRDEDTNIVSTKLVINDEDSTEIDNKNEVDEKNSMEVLEIIPLRDEVNITKKDVTHTEVIKELTYNETSEQMLAAHAPDTEGLETTEVNLIIPVRIEKHMRSHNKPKKAQDYVVAPED